MEKNSCVYNGMDFSNFKIRTDIGTYLGTNGHKLPLGIYGKIYMIKFFRKSSFYTNLGIDTQKVFLGKYMSKIVVACLDFRDNMKYAHSEFA